MKVAVYARVSTHDQTAENQLHRAAPLRRRARVERRRVRRPRRQRREGPSARARPARRRCASPSRASGRVLASRSSRPESPPPGDAARRLALARHRVRHARARASTPAPPPAGSSPASSARSRSSSVRAFKSAFELGLARVRAQGRRLGRKPCAVSDDRFAAVAALSTRQAAQRLGVSHTVVARWRAVNKTPLEAMPETPDSPASA